MALFKIKKGRDLNIDGAPSSETVKASESERFALLPPNFEGLKFKLEVKIGDSVKVGTALMSSRANPDVVFTSPAGGKVVEINRGEKRRLLEIVVEACGEEAFEEFPPVSENSISSMDRSVLVRQLLASGMWPFLIQRPFSRVADPKITPKSIFIRAMETEPNCADKIRLLEGKGSHLQSGIHALLRLSGGKVFLCWGGSAQSSMPEVLKNLTGAEIHQFVGPHPAGNVGTHIQQLHPINKGDAVWHIDIEHLAFLGEFLTTGRVPVSRVVAVAGSSATQRRYYATRAGASLASIIGGNVEKGEVRWISGGVLSGKTISPRSYLGFYNSTLTLIPEGGEKEVIGWLRPGFKKPTFSRFFASAFFSPGKLAMDTKVNGERRAIVATHIYDGLVALDLHTVFLVKACIAEDVEAMEALGLLECAPEDFSLCTYACVSKIEVDSIIRKGLDLLEKEG